MKYVLVVLLAACTSSSSTSKTPDAGSGSGSGAITLTIENYLSWCSVTENGGPLAATMTFPQGTVVNLAAMPASSFFIWGYWVGTDGDTGSAHDTSMTTAVTMSASKTVQACCPDAPPAAYAPCPAP
jgi:hypothetical protein